MHNISNIIIKFTVRVGRQKLQMNPLQIRKLHTNVCVIKCSYRIGDLAGAVCVCENESNRDLKDVVVRD